MLVVRSVVIFLSFESVMNTVTAQVKSEAPEKAPRLAGSFEVTKNG